MLGGLARWLRGAGYDAFWQEGIEDRELVRLADREGYIILTSDADILECAVVRDKKVPVLFIPRGLGKREQLGFVFRELKLEPLEPRCMACGGELADVPKESVRDEVPPRSFAWRDRFWKCSRCGQLFWVGTHYGRITEVITQVHREANGKA